MLGLLTSIYALYVETKLDDPTYEPGCNNSWGSCATVFRSTYAHMLSHLGLLPRGHALDLSLATIGILLYACYYIVISIRRPFPFREELFLAVASSGVIFSCILLYVIHYILHDFCIVCATFHFCNFMMLFLAVLEFRNPEVKKVKTY